MVIKNVYIFTLVMFVFGCDMLLCADKQTQQNISKSPYYNDLANKHRQNNCAEFYKNFNSPLARHCAVNGTNACEGMRILCSTSNGESNSIPLHYFAGAIAQESRNFTQEDQNNFMRECLNKKTS